MSQLKIQLTEKAFELGFDQVGFSGPTLPNVAGERLREFVALGRHGTMAWMEGRHHHRESPVGLWPDCKSVMMLAMNYGPDQDPLLDLDMPDVGNISVYARGKDYHDVIKKKLKAIGRWMAGEYGCELKVFVDTAPVMEKTLAAQAGLGWQGKHTNLVSRQLGSWFFIGAIYTTLDIEADPPHREQCGSCRACLDACPTDAFPAPFQIDARRCISYLTIEHKGPVDEALRPLLGNRIYGCDDCLAACPWNKFAGMASEASLHARDHLKSPKLADLLALDDATFRQQFSGSPIKRIGVDHFIRNVIYAMGNSGDRGFIPLLQPFQSHPADHVVDAAGWAINRLSALKSSS